MNLQLHICLLGTFECRWDNKAFDAELSRKTRAILGYLAASDRALTRQALYHLFCQEADDPAGTLRWHLSRLRHQLDPDIIITQRDTIQFNHDAAHVDSHIFQQHIAANAVRDALELYRGEFMEGLSLPDAPEIEMWLLGERTHLRQQYERGLLALVEALIEDNAYEEALEWAQDLVQSNPLLEIAHARVMWLYAMLGQRESALKQFDRCRDILQHELAVEPFGELADLYEQITAGDITPRFVVRPAAGSIPDAPEPSPLVGREAELQRLHRARQSGGVVIVRAEAGGGKSSLVEAFGGQVPDGLFVTGRSYESTQHIPYYPWVTLLEQYIQALDNAWSTVAAFWLEHLDRLLPRFAERRGTLHSIGSLTGNKEHHLFRAVSELLLRLTDRPPLIIFLDDLQWADGASLRLLHYLVLESQTLRDVPPMLLIGAFRPEEADDNAALNTLLHDLHRAGNVITLDLSPLDTDAIDILIQRHNLNIDAGDVWEATRGNPLYVVEILNELVHMTGERLPIPPSLNSLVQRRLGQLNASGRQVMEAIAVIDSPVTSSTAHQVSGRSEDEVADAIDAGLRWGFLYTLEDTRPLQFDYQHNLLREAVRAQLTFIRRQRLHERAATTLMVASAPPSQIAYHWHMAGDDAQEGQFSLLAGKEAARLFAHDDAIRYLQRALKLVQDPAVGADILVRLGDVHFTMGEWQAAEGRYRVALVLASAGKHQLQLADAKSHLGMLLCNQGDYDAALKASQEALAIYRELGNLKGQMYCIGSIGSVHRRQANCNEALECYETHYDMAIEINDLEGAMAAQGSTAGVYTQIGEHELALQNFEQALDLAYQINDQGRIGKIIGNMGLVYQLIGDYENAMRCFFGQLTHDYELEDKLGIATAVSNVAAMSALEGHYEAALQCSAYHLQQSLSMNDRRAMAIVLNNISLIDTRRGSHQRAEQLSKLAIQLARSLGIRFQLCAWLHQDALRLFERGDIARAHAANREALTIAREIERKEIAFDAQVLDVELRVRLGELSVHDAAAELKTLLDNAANDKEQAAILYTMWRIDSSDSKSAEQAAALYRDLYPTSPDILYRERYHELTGETLPLATTAPDLPDFITEQMADVDELILQVKVVLDKSRSM